MRHTITLATLGLALLGGCLEREESITIGADGAVAVEHHWQGDANDLDGGAAAAPAAGFEVKRFTTPRKDASPQQHRVATARYASVDALPTTFGDGPHALRWQDRLDVRREGGKTVRVFTRTYAPRRWAPFAFGERKHLPEALRKLIDGWQQRPWEEKQRLIDGVLAYERHKQATFLAQALTAVVPSHPRRAEAALAAREALAAYVARTLPPREVERLLKLPEAELAAKSKAVLAALERAALAAAATPVALDEAGRARLQAAYRAARRTFEVSEDLGDESFVVRLTLPGRIVRHNGETVDGATVTFRFDGKDLRDRAHHLIAVAEAD